MAILKSKKTTKPQIRTKQESTPIMSTKKNITETLKSDLKSASYEVAATQITAGTKAALINLMKSQGMNKSQLAGLVAFLETEIGTAAVSFLTGVALSYAPMISEDPRAQVLAEKFRVKGMATVGNVIMGEATQTLMPMVMNAIAALPEQPAQKARVQNLSNAMADDDEELGTVNKSHKVRSISHK